MGSISLRSIGRSLLFPFLAVITALIIGAVIMLLSGDDAIAAYKGLFQGAFGSPSRWAATIRKTTPLILTGLSVAVAFKAGLFNIGASGQFIMGTVAAVAVGVNFEGLPGFIHMPLALAAGVAGGAVWGMIPGVLKVVTGAHEVIVTIMLNYIASLFAGWTVYAGGSQGQHPGPLWDTTAGPISETADIFLSARMPYIVEAHKVHWGVVLALLTAFLMWWIIYKTTFGFELRTVGQNANAARYSGMSVARTVVMAMVIAGGLAGLAGGIETLGLNHKFAPEFSGAVGFDGITVALLGQTHPLGAVFAAFLLGSMDAGAAKMQFESGVAADIIQVIQALVLAFVAAPTIIRQIYRIKPKADEEDSKLSVGWG